MWFGVKYKPPSRAAKHGKARREASRCGQRNQKDECRVNTLGCPADLRFAAGTRLPPAPWAARCRFLLWFFRPPPVGLTGVAHAGHPDRMPLKSGLVRS